MSNYERINELAAKAKDGSMDSLEELCREKSQSILYHAMKYLNDKQDAQDAAQEALIKICRGIGSLKDPSLFNGWAHRIVRNTCYEFQKKRRADSERRLPVLTGSEPVETDRDAIPHAYAEDRDSMGLLLSVVAALPAKRRDAIMMYYYDEMSYAEIAEAMEVSVSTVSTNIMRARKAIKKAYEKSSDKSEERDTGKMRVGDVRYAPGAEAGVLAMLPGALHGEASFLVGKADVELLMGSVKPLLAGMKTAGMSAGHGSVSHSATVSAQPISAAKMLLVAVSITAVVSAVAIPMIGTEPDLAEPVPEIALPIEEETTQGGDSGIDTAVVPTQAPIDRVAGDNPLSPATPRTARPSESASGAAPTADVGLPIETEKPKEEAIPETEEESIISPDLSIVFIGGDCDCGHVNPDGANIVGAHSHGEVFWSIYAEDGGDSLYSGTGNVIEGPFANLAAGDLDGSYVIKVRVIEPSGDEWRTSVNFLIISDYQGTTLT
jgi:RNA polymerase sigma-70 factor (ECF subfamily)